MCADVEQCGVVKITKYELVPPDGGWGYMICLAATIIFACLTMFLGCFGLIFNEFLKQLDMGSTSVTLLSGVSAVSVALAGFLTGPLLRVMSLRQLALLASVLFNAGTFGTVFANTKLTFFLCQGLLQYTGIGILFNVTLTFVNGYFLKKRFFAMSLIQSTAALSTMLAPLLVKWSLTEVGFRGTLIIISAVSMQTFVAIALLQPVDRHMKKVELVENGTDEMKDLLKNSKKAVTTPIVALALDVDKSFDSKCVEKSFDSKCDILVEEVKRSDSGVQGDLITLNKINKVMDVHLLKRFCLSNATMGMTFCGFGDAVFGIMLPQALYAMGWTDETVAHGLTLLSLGDLVTRISFIFLSKWLAKIGNQEIYIAGLMIAILTRLGMLWTEDVTVMLIFITVMGVGRCTAIVLPPLILAETYDPDQFTSVYGLFMIMYGLVNISFGPAIGAIRDLTNSYPTAFYIIISFFAAVAMLWVIELCYKRNKHKRNLQRDALDRANKSNRIKGK